MLNIYTNYDNRETVWVLSDTDIENLWMDMRYLSRGGAPEYTVVKQEKIAQFLNNRSLGPTIDMFINCPNPDIHIHYDRPAGGRMIVTMRIRNRTDIEDIVSRDWPIGSSTTVAYMELVYMNEDGSINTVCVAPINMYCDPAIPIVSVGAIGFPNDPEISKLCLDHAFMHGALYLEKAPNLVQKLGAWKRIMDQALIIWTGVQYALSNPIVGQFARKDSEDINSNPKYVNHRDQKFKVCGMKKVYIDGGLAAFHQRTITRQTGAWFVHGHWRNTSSGKKVWVEGFWKGPDRNNPTKTEREVIIVDGAS